MNLLDEGSLRYIKDGGNILAADVDAIVIPVNCVGTMGAGLAQQASLRYSSMLVCYYRACRRNLIKPGGIIVWREAFEGELAFERTAPDKSPGPRYIVLLATKKHWRNPSREEWVDSGLKELAKWIKRSDAESIAVPALGCGLGGLKWKRIRKLTEKRLAKARCRVDIYEPGFVPKWKRDPPEAMEPSSSVLESR